MHDPGQWLDVHIPGLDQVGGFTITSAPSTAILAPLNQHPYIELAIQNTSNPPAAYLWQPFSNIRNTELQVRVGGSFTWPPPQLSHSDLKSLKRAVFIAGGIGINPLISMLSFISEKEKWPPIIRVFYSVRMDPKHGDHDQDLSSIVFLDRLKSLVRDARTWEGVDFKFRLVLTGRSGTHNSNSQTNNHTTTTTPQDPESLVHLSLGPRLQWSEIREAIGSSPSTDEAKDHDDNTINNSVVYICGPPAMTDEIVRRLKEEEGMEERRVLCEKWW